MSTIAQKSPVYNESIPQQELYLSSSFIGSPMYFTIYSSKVSLTDLPPFLFFHVVFMSSVILEK